MATIFSILLMLALCTFGMLCLAVSICVMAVVGIPSAMLMMWAEKRGQTWLWLVGVLTTTAILMYINSAYIAALGSSISSFGELNAQSPTWPLWIAACLHSVIGPLKVISSLRTAAEFKLLSVPMLICALLGIPTLVLFTLVPEASSSIFPYNPFNWLFSLLSGLKLSFD